MIDELTIYNLAIKYPNTVDLVREVEKMTIEECLNIVKFHEKNEWDGISWAVEELEELKEKKSMSEFYISKNIDVLKIDLSEHDAKVRTDAIEEYKDRLLELCDCGIERANYCVGGNCNGCLENSVGYSSIVDLAEELKEKKV